MNESDVPTNADEKAVPSLSDIVIPEDGWSWPEYPHLRLRGTFTLRGTPREFAADCMIFGEEEATIAKAIQAYERGTLQSIRFTPAEEAIFAAAIVALVRGER